MLEIGLFSLAWQLDPVHFNESKGKGSSTISTCIRPYVKQVEPDLDHATFVARTSDVDEIAFLLKKWEKATSDQPAWNRARKEEFRESILREFNEHTAVAVEQFVGHVSSGGLHETFQWRIVDRTEERVNLEAVPRDETDRLFYRSFRVLLNVSLKVPDQIVVVGRNQLQRIVWQSDQRLDAETIQLVNYVDDAPPSPLPLMKTADSRVD